MKMMEIIDALLMKNRTTVSRDFEECLLLLSDEIPLTIHRFPTGREYGTWIIPPQWDVRKAVLLDENTTIASYDDHPLFLAPYSCGFKGRVTKEELLKHVRSDPGAPDAFSYEFRLAHHFQKQLTDWIITLPHSVVRRLNKSHYFLEIDVETTAGNLLVGESLIRGQYDYTFALLTHLCHPGQANDGLTGVAVGVEVMKRLRAELAGCKFNYQLLIMPETIGSAVYVSAHENRIDSYLGAISIEMPGIRSPLRLAHTRRGDTYLDRILKKVMTERAPHFTECEFLESWGTDERVFDSPGVGIPTAVIERHPFRWYHTSADNLAETDPSCLEEIVEILVEVVRLIERDFIPAPRQRVPVYLSRYNLYADYVNERSEYDVNAGILELLFDGVSAVDIAARLRVRPTRVLEYLRQFSQLGLLETRPTTPEYWRTSASQVSR